MDLKILFDQQPGEESRVLAKLFDQLLYSFAPESFQDCPELDDASSVGHRRSEIHAIAMFAPLKIRGRRFEGARQRFAIPAKDHAAVVRNIERLVRVHRP